MPKTSRWTPFGQLRFGGGPSRAKRIYDTMKASLGGDAVYDFSNPNRDNHGEAKLYANARSIARVAGTLERAGNQALPLKCWDQLPLLETDFGVVPSPTDLVITRQRNVQAKRLLPNGAILSNMVAGLRLILGTDFFAVRTLTLAEGGGAVPATPISDARVNARLPDAPAKWVQLMEPITTLSAPIAVGYSNADTTVTVDVLLAVGDIVMVQAGNSAQMEQVTVTAVTGAGTTRKFTGTFAKSHDVGALVTTMDWPWQFNPSRIDLIVVSTTAAADAERRRKVDEFMARLARGPSQWAIVGYAPPGALVVGPDALPFVIGATTIGSFSFALSP